MRRARYFGAALGAATAAGLFIACTLTQSLDYLQNGGGVPDVMSEDPAVVPEGGTEGGAKAGEVLVPNQTQPRLLAQDALSLYWVAAGTIMSAPKAGGAPTSHGTFPTPASLAVDPDPQGSIFLAIGNNVVSVPKAGGDGGIVFTAGAMSPPIGPVQADESSLFVLQPDPNLEVSELRRMAKDGGARVDIDTDGGSAASIMTIDSQTLIWVDPNMTPTTFYELAKTAPAGAAPTVTTLVNDMNYPEATEKFAVDGTTMYWSATDENTGGAIIISRKRQQGAPTIALYRNPNVNEKFGPIAIDATDIYVIDYTTSSVHRIAKESGADTIVIDGLQSPSSLVVDGTHIYVTAEATGNMGAVLKQKK